MLDRITVYPFLYLCQAKNLNLCIGIYRVSPPTRNVISKAIVSARLSSVTLILVPLTQSQLRLPFLWPMGTGRRASYRFVPQGGNRVPVSRAEVLFPLATHGWAEKLHVCQQGRVFIRTTLMVPPTILPTLHCVQARYSVRDAFAK